MEWIFDHFQLVLGIILVVAYLLRGVLGARVAGEDKAEGRRGPTNVDTAEQERTRQIQEEIRRRILARQRGEAPPQTIRPAAKVEPVPIRRQTPPPIVRRSTAVPVDPLADAASQAILERQRQLEEKMRLLRHSKEAGSGGLPQSPSRSWETKSERRRSVPTSAVFGELKEDLYRKGSLRRAFILREVLGQPLGLEMGPPNLPRR